MCAGTEVDDDRRVVRRELVFWEPENHPSGSYVRRCRNEWTRLSSDPQIRRSRVGLAARTSAAHFANIPPTDFPPQGSAEAAKRRAGAARALLSVLER